MKLFKINILILTIFVFYAIAITLFGWKPHPESPNTRWIMLISGEIVMGLQLLLANYCTSKISKKFDKEKRVTNIIITILTGFISLILILVITFLLLSKIDRLLNTTAYPLINIYSYIIFAPGLIVLNIISSYLISKNQIILYTSSP